MADRTEWDEIYRIKQAERVKQSALKRKKVICPETQAIIKEYANRHYAKNKLNPHKGDQTPQKPKIWQQEGAAAEYIKKKGKIINV